MPSQTFNSNGTFTWPGGITVATVKCHAAGGGGGNAKSGTSIGFGAGGGGGGAYSESVISKIGATDTVVVGSGFLTGHGNGGDDNGGDGGDSYFRNATTVFAEGGRGGKSGASTAAGGAGGRASVGFGTIKNSGGDGASGTALAGGAGGGAAGDGGDGGAASGTTGGTGNGTNSGNGGSQIGGPAAQDGFNYGGAGCGTIDDTTQGSGSGADGVVIIEWNTPATLDANGLSEVASATLSPAVGLPKANGRSLAAARDRTSNVVDAEISARSFVESWETGRIVSQAENRGRSLVTSEDLGAITSPTAAVYGLDESGAEEVAQWTIVVSGSLAGRGRPFAVTFDGAVPTAVVTPEMFARSRSASWTVARIPASIAIIPGSDRVASRDKLSPGNIVNWQGSDQAYARSRARVSVVIASIRASDRAESWDGALGSGVAFAARGLSFTATRDGCSRLVLSHTHGLARAANWSQSTYRVFTGTPGKSEAADRSMGNQLATAGERGWSEVATESSAKTNADAEVIGYDRSAAESSGGKLTALTEATSRSLVAAWTRAGTLTVIPTFGISEAAASSRATTAAIIPAAALSAVEASDTALAFVIIGAAVSDRSAAADLGRMVGTMQVRASDFAAEHCTLLAVNALPAKLAAEGDVVIN